MLNDRGFTLFEMLIATLIIVAVVGAIFAIVNPAHGTFAAQLETIDVQQRLRVGIESLRQDLLAAGSGIYAGVARRPLSDYFAPVLPYRIGLVGADAPGVFRGDRISLMYVPETSAQANLGADLAPDSTQIMLTPSAGCPSTDPSCGFKRGMSVVVMSVRGARNLFEVIDVTGPSLQVRHLGSTSSEWFRAGDAIAEVLVVSYWLKTDVATNTFQLMRYDAAASDVPVADNIVSLSFEYFGDPSAPRILSSTPALTAYGPAPPLPDIDNPDDGWGAGESCLYTVLDGVPVARLTDSGDGVLAPLPADTLTDGPWCADAASPERYDADLFRIRQVRVRLRVQAADASFRGAAGRLFARAGISRSGDRFVPDREIAFDVALRNLAGHAR